MTVYDDNPAGRLHNLLTRFRSNASNGAVWQAWAAALGVPASDMSEVMRCIGLVIELPGEIESELEKVDGREYDRDQEMRWKTKIIPVLANPFVNQPSHQVAVQVDDASLGSLEHCSFTLHKYRPQRPVAEIDVERIQELLAELEGELHEAEGVDPEVREFLLEHCEEMSHALRDMVIRGPAALADALDRARGAAHRRKDLVVRSHRAEKAWRILSDLLNVTAAALTIAATAPALSGSQVHPALEAPSQVGVVEIVELLPPPVAPPASFHSSEEATRSPAGG